MKLTPDYIASQVLTCAFEYDGTHTTCTITTKHGSKHVGTSACLDPANYDKEIGEQIAHKNALDKLWELEGYFISKLGLTQVTGQLAIEDHLSIYVTENEALNRNYHSAAVTVRVITKTAETPEVNPHLTDAAIEKLQAMTMPKVVQSWDVASGTAKTVEVTNQNQAKLYLDPANVSRLVSDPDFGRDVIKVVLANKQRLGVPSYVDGGYVGPKKAPVPEKKKTYMLTDQEAVVIFAGLHALREREAKVPWHESPRLRAHQEKSRQETCDVLKEFTSQRMRNRDL